jgi:hypothetical protein
MSSSAKSVCFRESGLGDGHASGRSRRENLPQHPWAIGLMESRSTPDAAPGELAFKRSDQAVELADSIRSQFAADAYPRSPNSSSSMSCNLAATM